MTTITRDLINPNFYNVTEDMDYATLCKRINKFKHLYISKGLKKGDNISIGTLTANTNMIACHFAAWELGIKTFLVKNIILSGDTHFYIEGLKHLMYALDKTCTDIRADVIHDFNMPIDPNNSGGLTRMDLKNGLYRKILDAFPPNMSQIMTMEEVAPMPGTDIQPWEVSPEDNCIQYSEDLAKIKVVSQAWWPKLLSHEQILDSVQKYLPDFTQDKVALSRALHHDFCIDYYFLPALMTATKIYDINVMDYTDRKDEQQILNFMVDYVNQQIEEKKIERVLVPDYITYDYMKNKKTKPFSKEVIFNIGKEIVKTH